MQGRGKPYRTAAGIALLGFPITVLAAIASTMMWSTPASADSSCQVTDGIAQVTLDRSDTNPTILQQDASGALLVDGAQCGMLGSLTAIDLGVVSGHPAQTAALEQTGAGGVFPCSVQITGTLRASDDVAVFGAPGENITAGNTAGGSGINLDACGSVGTITGVGQYDLVAGSGAVTLSAAGGSPFVDQLSVPAALHAAAGSSETLTPSSHAHDTVDFSAVAGPLSVNVSGLSVGAVANGTAVSGGATYAFGSTPVTLEGSAAGATTFYGGSVADTYAGQGSGNVLDFSNAAGNSLSVCAVTSSSCPAAGQAQLGPTAEPFSGISSFVGLAGGNTAFVAGAQGGFAFTGNGSGNVAAFAADPNAVSADMSTGTVQVAPDQSDIVSGISTVVGSSAGANVFVAGSSSATFEDLGGAGGDTVDFSKVATSGGSPLVVNLSGGFADGVPNYAAAVGPVQYSFSTGGAGFTHFTGAATGNTTFLAGATGGYTFTGSGAGNVADFSADPNPVTANYATGVVQVAPSTTDTVAGFSTILGSAQGGNVWIAGPSSEAFSLGSHDTIDFSSLTGPLAVNVSGAPVGPVANDTAVTGTATYSFGAGPVTFVGAGSGSTTFDAGSSADTFTGMGPGNTLDFSHTAGNGLVVCVVASSPCSGSGQALLGVNTESFSGISDIVGLATGNSTFVAGGQGGFSFTGFGTNNTALFASDPNSVTADLSTGFVDVGSGGTDLLSGISTVIGSAAGGNVFIAGSSSEVFADGGDLGNNAVDFSHVATSSGSPLLVNVSGADVNGLPDGAASAGAVQYAFASGGFTQFTGAATGHSTFYAGASRAVSFDGVGAANTLSFANVVLSDTPGVTLDLHNTNSVSSGTATGGPLGGTTDTFTGISSFVGTAGVDTFVQYGAGSYDFAGGAGANVVDLSAEPAGLTVDFTDPSGGCDVGTNDGTATGTGIADTFSCVAQVLEPPPDTTPPTVVISLASPHGGIPNGSGGWFTTGPVMGTVSAYDTGSGNSNIGSVDCTASIDGGNAQALTLSNLTGVGTSPTASGGFSISTPGSTLISCSATDAQLNTSAPQTKTVKLDTSAPPAPRFTKALPSFTSATSVQLSFSGTDATSGVASYKVQFEKANFNATGFSAWTTPGNAAAVTKLTYTMTSLAPGVDYCFRVVSTDHAGLMSKPSTTACTASLLDDRALARSAGWSLGSAHGYYDATFSKAASAGRTLTLNGFRGDRLAIQAVQCKTCGGIRVYVGSTLVRTISLVNATQRVALIGVPTFSLRSGAVKIVTTNAGPVVIDAVGASRT